MGKKSSKLEFLFSFLNIFINQTLGYYCFVFLLHFWNDRILIWILFVCWQNQMFQWKSKIHSKTKSFHSKLCENDWKRIKFFVLEIKSESFDWYVCVCVLFCCQHSFIWILSNLMKIFYNWNFRRFFASFLSIIIEREKKSAHLICRSRVNNKCKSCAVSIFF